MIFWTALRGSQNSSVALSQVMDNSWILEYDPETKRQSRELHTANSPRPKKATICISKIKSMFICFFDSQGIVHEEYVPPGQTVNQTFYREVLERLRKRMALCDQALHALGYCTTKTPHVTRQSPSMNFWQKQAFLWFLSPPIRPISVTDFFFFHWLKNHLKGRRFSALDNIQKSVTDELKGIRAEAFQHCYEQWKQRLRRCVAAQVNYFEGDNLDL